LKTKKKKVWLLEKLTKIKIFMHQKKSNQSVINNQSAIVIMNHRTRLDWLFYFCILYRLNGLSNIKIILKDGLKKIPGAGWAMQTALFIFIKRKWSTDKEIFTKFINYYKQIEKKVFVSMRYYCEKISSN
jgi:lysocardiolipin and lysophospholipid acyltransferase